MTRTIITSLISGIIFLSIGLFVGNEYQKNQKLKEKTKEIENQNGKSILEIYDSLEKQGALEAYPKTEINRVRNQACSKEFAENNLKKWLDFNYPDWKIITKIKTVESGDCTYDSRFTAINPHFLEFDMKEKEVIVLRLSYAENYEQFKIETLRGKIY